MRVTGEIEVHLFTDVPIKERFAQKPAWARVKDPLNIKY